MRELAAAFEVKEKCYQHWEYGRATPDYDLLVKIADYFGVGIGILLTVNLNQ
jgi:DNA-binding XRE family transcriptional regulator